VQSVVTCRAVMYLCMWRLNAVPPQLLTEWQQIEKHLVEVQTGKGIIPGMAPGTNNDRAPQLVHTSNSLLGPSALVVTWNGTTRRPFGAVPFGS